MLSIPTSQASKVVFVGLESQGPTLEALLKLVASRSYKTHWPEPFVVSDTDNHELIQCIMAEAVGMQFGDKETMSEAVNHRDVGVMTTVLG